MLPRIEKLNEKKLVGQHLKMSFAENRTAELWRGFMPLRNLFKAPVNSYLYSVELYPSQFFNAFDPTRNFEKWAAVEMGDMDSAPPSMEMLIIPQGLYAVFDYKGRASEAQPFYQYIFTKWLPQSGYQLDERPHFALMGDKYKNDDPASEEEIWIPIRPK